jgi:hypothetical protein
MADSCHLTIFGVSIWRCAEGPQEKSYYVHQVSSDYVGASIDDGQHLPHQTATVSYRGARFATEILTKVHP